MTHCTVHKYLIVFLFWAAMAHAELQNKIIPFPLAQQKNLGVETKAAQAVSRYPLPPLPAEVVTAPQHQYVISLPFSTTVEDLPVLPGQKVNKGDNLMYLQSPEILDLEGRQRQAQARFKEAKKRLDRVAHLVEAGVLAQKEVEMARTDMESALAEKESLSRTLRLANASDGNILLHAPEAGQVRFIHVRRGESVSPHAPLVTLAPFAHPWLEILVPVALLGKTHIGMEAEAGGKQGVLQSVGGVEPSTQMAKAQVKLTNAEDLLPGVQLPALLFVPGENLFLLPRSSLTEQGGKSIVFIAGDGGFIPIEVRRLGEIGENAIVEGALAGTQVVVRGTAAVKAAWGGQ